MSTIDRHLDMDFQVDSANARVLDDLQQTQAKPDLKSLAHSVVRAFARRPQVCAVAFAVNPSVAALLDPGWSRKRLHCLIGGTDSDQPEWRIMGRGWPEDFPLGPLDWGTGTPPAEVPWPEKVRTASSSKTSARDWARFQIRVRDCGAIIVSLIFEGSLITHPEWGQEVVQMQQTLQLVVDLWAELVSLGVEMRQLSNEKKALSRLNRLQGRFVGMATHEFKTPLTSITAYTDALLGLVDDGQLPHVSEFLGVIRTEAGRLLRMVNRILDFSRMEYGSRLLGGTPHDLGPLVKETIQALAPTMAAKKLTHSLECEKHLPRANVDADLIRQVLVNLIGNAVKFTPDGGHITVTLAETESSVEVRIADTGPGIPQHDIHRIFREFYRSRETASQQEGTGLGLTIVRHIINLHGGHVEARQGLAGGSVFTFRVPKEVHELGELPAHFTAKVDEKEARLLVAAVLQLVAEMGRAKSVVLMLLDQNDKLVPVAALGRKANQSFSGALDHTSGWGELLEGQEVHLAEYYPNLDLSCCPVGQSEPHSTMLAPFWSSGKPCGCMVVQRPAKGQKFQSHEMAQLEVLARIAGTALVPLNSQRSEDREYSGSVQVEKVIEAVRTLLQIGRNGVPTASVESLHLLGQLACQMDFPASETRDLKYAAALHDAGMARVEDEILLGETELSFDERDEVDRHVEQGVDLMSPLLPCPKVAEMIRHHHERFDGSGYPEGLQGEEIPLGSRLLAVIDAWFSLTCGRPFRVGLSADKAIREIRENAGSQFDPAVVAAFEAVLNEDECPDDTAIKPGPIGLGN
jgi:signal transduction histidine kinase